jgi:MFS family permease
MLILVTGLIAISFFGVNILLKSLYVLRLGYGPEYVGAYLSSGAFIFMGMGVPSGALGSRFGTRRIMLIGAWLTVIGMGLLPATEIVPQGLRAAWPFVTQTITTAGWSMFNVNLVPALVVATTERNRSAAYALSSAVRGLGTFLGTLVGGMLPGLFAKLLSTTLEAAAPYGYALFVGAGLGLLAIAPLMRIQGGQAPSKDDEAASRRGPFPFLPVAAMVVYVYLRHAGWATCQAFCNPYMDEGLHLSTATIGLITSIGQIGAIGASLLLPRLTDRWNPGRMLIGTTLGVSVSLLLLVTVPNWVGAGLGRLGVLVFTAMWLPTLQLFQMELVTGAWRSVAYGALTMAMGMGFGSSSFAGGYLIAARGYRTHFLVGVVLTFVASLLMTSILQRASRRKEAPRPSAETAGAEHGGQA